MMGNFEYHPSMQKADHVHGGHSHDHHSHQEHGHTHEHMDNPGSFTARKGPLKGRNWSERAFTVGNYLEVN